MAGMSEKKISEAREHLREAEKWYKVCFVLCYICCSDYCVRTAGSAKQKWACLFL